jgi:hypothetical protein
MRVRNFGHDRFQDDLSIWVFVKWGDKKVLRFLSFRYLQPEKGGDTPALFY